MASDYLNDYLKLLDEHQEIDEVEEPKIKTKKAKKDVVKAEENKPQPLLHSNVIQDQTNLEWNYSAYLSEQDIEVDASLESIIADNDEDKLIYQSVNLYNFLPNYKPRSKKKTIYEMTFDEEQRLTKAGRVQLLTHILRRYQNNVSSTGVKLYTPYPNKFRDDDPDNFKFYNTSLVSVAANYFKKFHLYCEETPITNPVRYKEFWDRWEFRRKHGMVLPIKGDLSGANSDNDLDEIWIPGKMVGMLNFANITRTDTSGVPIISKDGINFKDIMQNGVDLQEARRVSDEDLQLLFDSISGNKVVDTTFDFPDFWDGHYMYWVAKAFARRMGLGKANLKARRKGFSIVGGWDSFDEIDLYPRRKVALVAFLKEYLIGPNSMMKFVKDYHAFMSLHTDWSKKALVNNTTDLEYGYQLDGTKELRGFRSSITCRSAKDNPSCLRGFQANEVKYEESGSFPNIVETVGATEAAAESGGYTIGSKDIWGTASTKDSEFSGFASIIRNPVGNQLLAYDWGLYERKQSGKAICMFFPQNLNYEGGGMDADGNSDLTKGLLLYEDKLEWIKDNLDAHKAAIWQAERPLRPSQVLSTTVNNSFSGIAELINDQLEFLQSNKDNSHKDGKYLPLSNGDVEFVTNSELTIRNEETHPFIYDTADFLPNKFDLYGCIREYEPPIFVEELEDNTGFTPVKKKAAVPSGIYFGWHDPYAVDKNKEDITNKDSLGVTYVYMIANKYDKAAVGRMVASWIGRPPKTDEYNEQLYYLCKRYNIVGGMLGETDKEQFIAYFKSKRALNRLAKEPMLASFKGNLGKAISGRDYGFSMARHPDRKRTGVNMHLDFCKSEIFRYTDETSETMKITKIYRIQLIKCNRLLREMSGFNYEDNFDCVSAWLVGQYLLRELEDNNYNVLNAQTNNVGKKSTLASHEFFKRN